MNESSGIGPVFLQKKYRLNTDPQVIATERRRIQHGEKAIPEYLYSNRIQNYLDRLVRDIKMDKHGILKHSLYEQIIIKPAEVPESYFQSVIKRHEEEGRPIESLPEETKKDLVQTLINDQRESLDVWVNYFTSPDAQAQYPDWFKYYVLRSVLVMGRYDKTKKKFGERSKTGKSISQFPELDRDALNFVRDAIEFQQGTRKNLEYKYGISTSERTDFEKSLKEKDINFANLYAWAIDKINPISEELLQQTEGRWVTFPQGSDPTELVRSLTEYGTGWCIRGSSMAKQYLQGGNNIQPSELTVYYSNDKNGQAVVPRVVIVTRNGRIDEVRGVAKEEHLDQYITDVVEKKLAELPDGQKFKKRVIDMQQMTTIHKKCFSVDKKTGVKTYLSPHLNKEELIFLYELEGKIEGFGYNVPDPRIKEVRNRRNPKEDMPVLFGCTKEQIALNIEEIREDTKAYVGKLVPGIFKLLPAHIEYVYTTFPEGRIKREQVTIGGQSKKELENAVNDRLRGFRLGDYARDMIKHRDFTTLQESEEITTIRLKVSDFGFTDYPTTDELFKRAETFGLELCPAEVGPHLRLKDTNQPLNEWYYIAMKQIAGSGGSPGVFGLARDGGGGLWLCGWAIPGDPWFLDDGLVFRLRK